MTGRFVVVRGSSREIIMRSYNRRGAACCARSGRSKQRPYRESNLYLFPL